jgi:DNA helicase-2/ATP-dependent DNA helicase PcrA
MKVCADLNEVCSHDWITPEDEVDGVQLMTVFSAKGQEWDYVFLLNVVDGVYPRPQKTESKQLEEQRVFYVGITRHHRKLYLLQSVYATQTLNNGSMKSVTLDQKSPFIDLKNQGLVYHKKRRT